MDPKNIRRAAKTLRLNRRSYGASCKRFGKKYAHKAERRLGKAMAAERAGK